MSEAFQAFLDRQLKEIESERLLRHLRPIDSAQGTGIKFKGAPLLNFSSNDYLGLANADAIRQAAREAVEQYGAGSGASRLVCGSLQIHHELEKALARFRGCDAALSFSSGYAAAVGTVVALMGKSDAILLDKKAHASLIDAARLSGAAVRVFKHNDLADLQRVLESAQSRKPEKILVVVESVYSMDGDLAPLPEIVELTQKQNVFLLVDEAHAIGLFGKKRRGLLEEFGLEKEVDVQLGTLGKAIGSAGGFVAGSERLIRFLVNRARSFIFSTAPVPAATGAALAGIHLIESSEGEERRATLWARVDAVKNGLIRLGVPLSPVRSAIIPIIIGAEEEAVAISEALLKNGILIPAIRYPAVPRREARLRLTLCASHQPGQIEQLLQVLGELNLSRFFR